MFSQHGFIVLVVVVVGLLLAVNVLDLWLTWAKRQPVGHYVHQFTIVHPWFAGVVAVVVGAMVAHFFLHITNG